MAFSQLDIHHPHVPEMEFREDGAAEAGPDVLGLPVHCRFLGVSGDGADKLSGGLAEAPVRFEDKGYECSPFSLPPVFISCSILLAIFFSLFTFSTKPTFLFENLGR